MIVGRDTHFCIVEYIGRKKASLLLGVDTNAQSQLYGTETNKRGEMVEEIILRIGLGVANVGLEPTSEIVRGGNHIQTHIDVTLFKGDIDVLDWKVDKRYNASDHNTITWVVEDEVPLPDHIELIELKKIY